MMKLSMIVKDETGDMEITAFDKQAESMTNINLSLLHATEEISKSKVPDKIKRIIDSKFTIYYCWAITTNNVLTYRIYKVDHSLSHASSSTGNNLAQTSIEGQEQTSKKVEIPTDLFPESSPAKKTKNHR